MRALNNKQAFEQQIRTTHKLRTSITVTDLNGKHATDISARLLDGQVNIDTTAETSRQLSLTFDDPTHSLALDSSSPSDGALFTDRMVSIELGVFVESIASWVDVPVFVGPMVTMQRDGGQVQVSCLGKEHLASAMMWRPMTLKRGMHLDDAIKTILRERAGETRFSIPSTKRKLPDKLSMGRTSIPWVEARKLANVCGWQLYYDGAGVCRARQEPRTSLFTFDSSLVLSDPSVSYDLANVRNAVWVKGRKKKRKGQKGTPPMISVTAVAGSSHALSPWSLGRSGAPRYLVELIEEDGIRSRADAARLARTTLNRLLVEFVSASFDSLPVPHLDPLDVVTLKTSDISVRFSLKQASIPLTHSGSMSVGTLKNVRPSRKAIR